jgi:ABC-type Fe3+/spermidine/putrescine transport system ATPase subunit
MSGAWSAQGLESVLGSFRLGPVDLTLEAGSTVAVLGPSGAGKTTLLRTIAGFLPARSGRLLHDGVDVTDRPPEARGLGYVPQGLGLLPHRTVAGNVRYPMEVRRRPDAAARTRGLLERFRLEALADRRPAALSGGEQQRVALARALAAEPRLIVWDEPWQGLDVLTRQELGLVLRDLKEVERVPTVIVTHDPALAFSVADRFLVLDRGRVRSQGPAATLLGRPVDAFAARFVGFENVFDAAALTAGRPSSVAAWLGERAGAGGIAFEAPTVPPTGDGSPVFEGVVRGVLPMPSGVRLEVDADGIEVVLRLSRTADPAPWAVGRRARFTIDPTSLHRLEADSP